MYVNKEKKLKNELVETKQYRFSVLNLTMLAIETPASIEITIIKT